MKTLGAGLDQLGIVTNKLVQWMVSITQWWYIILFGIAVVANIIGGLLQCFVFNSPGSPRSIQVSTALIVYFIKKLKAFCEMFGLDDIWKKPQAFLSLFKRKRTRNNGGNTYTLAATEDEEWDEKPYM